MPTPALFTPYRLRDVTWRNRVAVSPMCQYLAVEGVPNEWHVAHHARFALGGVGAAIIEATGIVRDGRITHGCTGLWNDEQVAAFKPITALYRAHGVKSGIQLGHSGGKGSTARPWEGAAPLTATTADPPWEIVAASAVPMRGGWPAPRPATIPEIEEIVAAFGAAAKRAVEAGFDMIEIHGAHGYLLHNFVSPATNHRSDAFGGTLEKRHRLPFLVAEEMRRVIPAGMPLIYRASLLDGIPEGGATMEDSIALCRGLKARGVDLIDCSSGGVAAPVSLMQQKMPHGYHVPLAERVKHEAGIDAMAVGLITDPVQANAYVAEGRCDAVALARELLADPNWPYHAAIALGHDAPESVLPMPYGFYLERRAQAQGR
jgi:2,4-dienoyl-CoA reductase-like NADH-dependent reductase (Old Yellow Enzyme family)